MTAPKPIYTQKNIASFNMMVKQIGKLKSDKRIGFLLRFLQGNPFFLKIGFYYTKGDYKKCLELLLGFIKKNKKSLNLEPILLNDDFVNTYLNDYPLPNHAVIKNQVQLTALFKSSSHHQPNSTAKTFQQLIKRAGKAKRPLLLIDKSEDKKIMFSSLLHEVNAWLCSGCATGSKSLICLIHDWRIYLPKQKRTKLDNYVLGLPYEA